MTFLEERDLSDVPSIKEYFKGKTIFITGGSGFMGNVLIEKLLFSCTDLERIYLLLREKKGVKPEDRLAAFYENVLFDRLKREKPGVFETKVVFIGGDISAPGLGISDEDRALLINNVNIVFHVAASVRFDDSLDYAATLNLRGTKEMVDLATEMVRLESFVHVSTGYSNKNDGRIDEIIYPPHADWRDTINVCENFDKRTLEILTPKYLGNSANTYVFTKQLAEHVIYEQRGKLPIVITRPSIVVSTHSEPIAGWTANFNGPVGLCIGIGKGLVRTLYAEPNLTSDFIPVDYAIRHFIAAAWIRGTKKLEASDEIPVYHCCAGNLKAVTTREVAQIGRNFIFDVPLNDNLWGVSETLTSNVFIYYLCVIFSHLLPAVFIDLILRLLGKKPMLVKIQRRIYNVQMALKTFTLHQWSFINSNFVKLRSVIKGADRNEFNYPMEDVDEVEFFRNSTIGARRFLLKEKDEDYPKARKQIRL
ncbi:unnamed protein product [Leptosia nina]|uniref:Fatty acyl-CoA reductase n=1 Tax=Leptosia nina TaxID=320188 RepID=A0AAV1JDF1_9NEOP